MQNIGRTAYLVCAHKPVKLTETTRLITKEKDETFGQMPGLQIWEVDCPVCKTRRRAWVYDSPEINLDQIHCEAFKPFIQTVSTVIGGLLMVLHLTRGPLVQTESLPLAITHMAISIVILLIFFFPLSNYLSRKLLGHRSNPPAKQLIPKPSQQTPTCP